MCKDKHWEGIKDEMFENRVKYPNSSCCTHLLVTYRAIAFLFLLQTVIHFIIILGANWYVQLAFMTIWGEILTIIAFGGMVCITPWKCREVYCHRSCFRFVHLIYTLALCLGVLIFLIFWFALSPYLVKQGISATGWWIQIQLHFITQMLILVDFILSDIFFHKWQYLIVLAVGLAYVIVNGVVTLTAFTVYPILTWRDIMTAVWFVVSLGIVTGAFFLFWWLGQKKKKRRERNEADDQNIGMEEGLMKRPEEEEEPVKQSVVNPQKIN